jgi:hypothetical protein
MTNTNPIVLRDGLAIAQPDNWFGWMLRHSSTSVDHAIKHEGYSVEERANIVRGWSAYLRAADDKAQTGMNRFVVHAVRELEQVSREGGHGKLEDDGFFTDRVALPQLTAIRAALNYLTGDLAIIAAELDAWTLATAVRLGLDADSI